VNESFIRWAASVKWFADCKRESVGVLIKPHEWVCPHCGVIHERSGDGILLQPEEQEDRGAHLDGR